MPAPIIVRRNVLHRGVAAAAAPGARSIITASTPKQYLTTTWGHAQTDVKKATISYWINWIISPPGVMYIFSTATSGSTIFDHQYSTFTFKHIVVDDFNTLYNVTEFLIAPDSGVWHHVLVQIDTTQAVAADRIKIYVDGILGADPPAVSPALNSDMGILSNGIASYIGEVSYNVGTAGGIPDAKFAYFHVIDGQALTPSSFTTGTGVGSIHPITYAGTFGANGFFLNGANGTLADQGPNSVVWTAPNGITYSTDLPT